jgi:large subunit ribosomal protein L22
MEFRASHRFAPISARKARLVVDMVRGRPVNQALELLQVTNKRASGMTSKVIKAALASAEDREDVEVDLNRLYVARAWVDEGPDLPGFRYVAGPRGRYMPIRVRRSHIHVALAEAEEEVGRRGRSAGRGKSRRRARRGKPAEGPSEPADAATEEGGKE